MSRLNDSGTSASPLKSRLSTSLLDTTTSPNVRVTGTSKRGYTLANTFSSHMEQWFKYHQKGIVLCQGIKALRLHEYIELQYPIQLKILIDSLGDVFNLMKNTIESMEHIVNQCNALAKLEPDPYPLFNTWSAVDLSISLTQLYCMFVKELEVKLIVKENIAHCRDDKVMEVYSSAWEYNIYLSAAERAFLLAELK